jgi:hypothetical protein
VALAVTVDVDGRDETLNPTVFRGSSRSLRWESRNVRLVRCFDSRVVEDDKVTLPWFSGARRAF